MIYFYGLCFLLSTLLLIWFISFNEQHCLKHMFIVLFTTISSGGYFAFILSTNLNEALLANKIFYVGGAYLPMAIFFITCEVSHVKVYKWISILACVIQTVIYGLVFTTGFTEIYYKSVDFAIIDGVPTLIKVYGPLHFLYNISLYGYLIGSIVVALVNAKKKEVNLHNVYRMVGSALLSGIIYFAQKALKLQYDLMPLVFVIEVVLIYMPIIKSHVFSIAENASNQFKSFGTDGFIEFDVLFKYMEADEYIINIFPELKNQRANKRLKVDDSLFFQTVYPLMLENKDNKSTGLLGTRVFSKDNKHYEARVVSVRYQGIKIGYLIQVQDVTDKENNLHSVERYNEDLKRVVELRTSEVYEIRDKTLLAFAQMVESRDLSTGGHIKRTAAVVKVFTEQLIADDYGLSKYFLYNVVRGAAMHDIGKISVDDKVLRKQGKYTDEEYNEMKKHSAAGAEIIEKVLKGIEKDDFVRTVSNIAHYHHEKVDGSGYPCGLTGENIPVEARIMALADVFDALVSKRCYKEAFSFDKAFLIIEESKGTHFDDKLTEEFMKCRPVLETLYSDTNFSEV